MRKLEAVGAIQCLYRCQGGGSRKQRGPRLVGPIRTSAYLLTPHLVRSDEPVPIAPISPAQPDKKAPQQASHPAPVATNDPATDDSVHPAPPAPKRAITKAKELNKNIELKNTELASYCSSAKHQSESLLEDDPEIEALLADIKACLADAHCSTIRGLSADEHTLKEIAKAIRTLTGEQRTTAFDSLSEEWLRASRRAKSWGLIVTISRTVCDQVAAGVGVGRQRSITSIPVDETIDETELRQYLTRAVEAYRANGANDLQQVADEIESLANNLSEEQRNLETLERKMNALEQRSVAIIGAAISASTQRSMEEAVESQLAPYRGKVSAAQMDMLRQRYLETTALQTARLPRLSLFCMGAA
jgi:hypothetical protein